MKTTTFLASVGLGIATGAAAVLLMPKHSQAYRVANDAAHTIKMEAGRMWESMKDR